jgi:plasmid maintenance system antidote protein VapI
MVIAGEVVKNQKISAPEAARLYAYIATTYYEMLRMTNDQDLTNAAAKSMLLRMYPKSNIDNYIKKIFNTHFNANAYQYLYTNPTSSSLNLTTSTLSFLPPANHNAFEWLEKIFTRERTDGFYASTSIHTPNNAWKNMLPLETPHAGSWEHWIVPSSVNFEIPTPPATGSATYRDETKKIIALTNGRTAEHIQIVQLWFGEKNQITLNGQWQDILWETKQKNSSETDPKADLMYAYKQMLLAQALADTHSIVWKIKYTYWRPTPLMVVPDLKILVATPHSPSYVSEDAATTAVAQKLLSIWFPEHSTDFEKKAKTLLDTTVWSGKCFELDTKAGFALGEKIGVNVESVLQN